MSRTIGFFVCALLSASQWLIVGARLAEGAFSGWTYLNVVSGALCALMALDILCGFPLMDWLDRKGLLP